MPPQASVSQASSGLESGLRQLGLEIARHFQDRGAGIGAIGDAGDAALQPPRIGWLAVLEDRRLHPRRVKILHLISRDHAAAEAADAGKILCARDVARLRGSVRQRAKRQGEQQEDRPEQACSRVIGNPFIFRKRSTANTERSADRVKVATGDHDRSNCPQSWPVCETATTGPFVPARMLPPRSAASGRARNPCLFAAPSQEWSYPMLRLAFVFGASLAMFACLSSQADAAQCGSSAAGYDAWKQQFAGEARAKGVSAETIQALMATNYAQATINADRGQRSFSSRSTSFSPSAARRPSSHGALAEGVAGRAVCLHPAALRRAAGAAARDLGHGDRFWQPARQPEHARLDRDARL